MQQWNMTIADRKVYNACQTILRTYNDCCLDAAEAAIFEAACGYLAYIDSKHA